MRKRLGRLVGLYVLKALLIVVRVLPLGAGLAIGRMLGRLIALASKKRVDTALANLQVAFGDSITREEQARIAHLSFEHFGMFAIESLKLPYLSDAEFRRRVTYSVEDEAIFRSVMAQNKGCLLISAHLGSFECAGRHLASNGFELIALARESRDQGTTRLMVALRKRMGIDVITLRHSLKPVFAGLKRNACVAIVCDQNASDIFVPFFGERTGTVDGPARISIRTGAPMTFFTCFREAHGIYRIKLRGSVIPTETKETPHEVARMMTEVNARLEEAIRERPEQWLWFHDRWRASRESAAPGTET